MYKRQAVAVLEAKDTGLGESRVVDSTTGLFGRDVFQGDVFVLVFDVDEDGVALVERAAARILAG